MLRPRGRRAGRAARTAAALLCLPFMGQAFAATGQTPHIEIEADNDRQWSATYTLARSADSLVFARSPDASRAEDWTPPPGFEIGRDERGEFVRRTDGRRFRKVVLRMPAAYRHLPMDYAPFSPFGDGGMLVHTGRFFACVSECGEAPQWHMSLIAPPSVRILLDGKVSARRAAWMDRDSGRNLYVGPARPVGTADLITVMDAALPKEIRERLDDRLPRFLHYYAAKLGRLPARPMLFASYDAAFAAGWGRQGGVLPGQVFTHFYGPVWDKEMAKPGFDFDLAWFFAHEAAHLYQHQITVGGGGDSWVHEGAAEAMASIALRDMEPTMAAALDKRVQTAREECAKSVGEGSLRGTLTGGTYQAAYSCGLVLNLALDTAVRQAKGGSDGLFDVWRAMVAEVEDGEAISLPRLAEIVAPLAGQCAASALLRTSQPVPVREIEEALRGCGAPRKGANPASPSALR
jgi:hypothetical protein